MCGSEAAFPQGLPGIVLLPVPADIISMGSTKGQKAPDTHSHTHTHTHTAACFFPGLLEPLMASCRSVLRTYQFQSIHPSIYLLRNYFDCPPSILFFTCHFFLFIFSFSKPLRTSPPPLLTWSPCDSKLSVKTPVNNFCPVSF